jgi:DNA-binding transcriptional LysR family regulator
MSTQTRRLQQLRLRDLRLLDEIDRHGTLRGVALALFVSQPAVSQALRSLEDAVGTALALRSPRGVTLTDAGQSLLLHLQSAESSLAAGLAALREQVPRPVLRVGTIPYALTGALPAAIARLGPAPFTLRISSGAVDALMDALHHGRVDAVVTRLAPTRTERGRRVPPVQALVSERVTTIRNAVACGRDHPFARRRPTLTELARSAWVLPDERSAVRNALADLFSRAGLPAPQPCVVSGNFADNLRIAATARLLTVAPVDVIAQARPSMKVLLAPPEWGGAVVLAHLAHRAGWPPLEALRRALTEGSETVPEPDGKSSESLDLL